MTAEVTDLPVSSTEYSEDDLRAAVRELKDGGMNLTAQAKEAGVPYGSFTNWVNGTYEGNTQRIAGQVSQWLAARAERKSVAAKIRSAPAYVETPTARDITMQLTYAQTAPDLAVIVGTPGIGKTKAAEHYQGNNPNVFMMTALDTVKSPFAVLDELATVIGVTERRTTRLNRAIRTKLKDSQALIIIDEAQNLSLAALDEIRSFLDLGNIGLALIGDTRLHGLIHGKGREGKMAQLSSRVGMRTKQFKSRPEDIAALASAWGILDPKMMRLLQKIGGRDGALRILTKTLRLASISAAGAGEEGLTEAAINAAFQQLAHDTAA